MISIEEAVAVLKQNLPPRKTETVAVNSALQAVLAGDIVAPEPSPRFTNSAMDGFAVRWSDIGPAAWGEAVSLTVVGESRAGHPYTGAVRAGQAVRINTGAVVPEGTDTVIPVEDTELDGATVRVLRAGKQHQHVRFAGEEFQTGEVVLRRGTVMTPAAIGLLVSLGIEAVPVYRRPRVAVLVTGSELVGGGAELLPGQIRDSNGPMLAAAVEVSGGVVVHRGRVGDELRATREKLEQAAEGADLLLLSGGVSVGPHDLVRAAAAEAGFETLFWRIKQKPGKPLFAARREDTLLFGLPGNPVSALNSYAYYVHPLIVHLLGKEFRWEQRRGRLTHAIENRGSRSTFVRVRLCGREEEHPQVAPLEAQGSHMLTSMAHADGFILMPPRSALAAGQEVVVFLYPWRY